jgi:protein-tyrosine phosphatase
MGRLSRVWAAVSIRICSWLALRAARAATASNLAPRRIERVLVICHGNIYRSPFVAELLRSSQTGVDQIRSAGFHLKVGRQAPARHQAMSRDLGVSLEQHRSCLVSGADLQWADIIVLMDRYNWVRLTRLGADPRKLVWIGALTDGSVEIPDPYHLDDQQARAVLERLKACTEALARRMRLAA